MSDLPIFRKVADSFLPSAQEEVELAFLVLTSEGLVDHELDQMDFEALH